MKQHAVRLITGSALVLGGLAAAGGTAQADAGTTTGTTATGTTATVPYECRTWVRGGTHPVYDYTRAVTTRVPSRVRAGHRFPAVYDPAPITAFAEFNQIVEDVRIAYRIPAGAQVKKTRLVGGSGLGGSRVRTWIHGSDIVVSASGPLQGGVEFDLPTLVVTYKAPKRTGALNLAPGGSGYENPGFYWWRYQPTLKEWGAFECFPDPAKPATVLATTQVENKRH